MYNNCRSSHTSWRKHYSPQKVFETVVGLEKLPDIIALESNRYATQKDRNFTTTNEEITAFLGTNFVMAIKKLPSIEDYWSVDKFI